MRKGPRKPVLGTKSVRNARICEFEIRVNRQEVSGNLFTFLRFDGTGRINDISARPDQFGCILKDMALFLYKCAQIVRLNEISDFRVVPYCTRPGTWRVDQQGVETALLKGEHGLGVIPDDLDPNFL